MGAYVSFHLRTAWWSGCRDLNPGPLRPERSALPSCATARGEFPRSPIILLVGSQCRQRLNRARDLGYERWMELDDEFADATLLYRLHPERPIAVGEGGAGDGNLAREVED